MGVYGFFGQPAEEREAAQDWYEDQWDRQDAHVQDYKRWRRWGMMPIYRPLVQPVGN